MRIPSRWLASAKRSLEETELFDSAEEAIYAGGELWSDYSDRIERGHAELYLWKHDICPDSEISHSVYVRSLTVNDYFN